MRSFAKFAWGVLGFNILVILWGAFVRATGSGAGCGAHWPLCNGEVIPRQPQVEALIEFTHRLTSGVAFLLVVGLLIFAWRSFPASHPVRRGALLAMVFMILEALVGAGLVLFELVAENQSLERVVAVSLHLINTFLLLASLALTAWWASDKTPSSGIENETLKRLFGLGLAGVVFLGVSGAITALGDTLFPSASLAEGLRQDFSPAAHFLVRLRIWHPVIAILAGLWVAFLSIWVILEKPAPAIRNLAFLLLGLFGVQWVAGLVNLLLLAPIYMQIIHLLLADLVWIVLVLLASATVPKRRNALSA